LLKICLICVEFFGSGVYGGFGRATRKIGQELAQRNIEVTAVVPRRKAGGEREYFLDGIRVLEFPQGRFWTATQLFRQTDADVFHSQEPSLSTWLAMKAMPDRAHVVTFRDPMEIHDWRTEYRHAGPALFGTLRYALYLDNFLTSSAVRRADGLYCAAEFLIPKATRKYGLRQAPGILPTPVEIPPKPVKSGKPAVCCIGRLHRRKRPELFLDLARIFPDVQFICVGGTNEPEFERRLRQKYADLPNVEMTGTVNQFQSDQLQRILEKCWVLVNTAEREGLPNTFLEAAAHRCAILSIVDPDGFASRFGYRARDTADLANGLASLLCGDRWKSLGEAGCRFVEPLFGTPSAIESHLQAYSQAIETRARRSAAPSGPLERNW